jgi:hypothetical protein
VELRKLLLKIEADNSQILAALGSLNNRLDTTKEKTKEVGDAGKKSGDDLIKSFNKYSSAMFRALGVVNMFKSRLVEAFNAASEGARISAAESFFQNSGKSIEELRVATKGMIADAELMKKANLADSMGISIDTFKTLAQVAQASALKTGQSFEYMFESIIVGTARSSRLLLDNLGIIVSVDEANRNYATTQLQNQGVQNATNAQIENYIQSMDDAAKKVAFADEVQRKSTGTLLEMQDAVATSAGVFDHFSASVENLGDTLKKALAEESTGFTSQASTILDYVNRLITRFGVLKGLLAGAGMTGTWLMGSADQMNDMMYKLDNVMKFKDQQDKSFLSKNLDAQINLLKSKLDPGESWMGFMKFFEAVGDVGDKTLNGIADEILRINKLLKYYDFGSPKAGGTTKPPPTKAGGGKKPKETDIWEATVRDAIAMHEKIADQEAKSILEFEKWLESLEPSFADLQKESERLAAAQELAAIGLEDLGLELMQPISDAVGELVSGLASGGGIFGPLAGFANKMAGDKGTGGAISSALSGAGTGAGMAGPLGAALGALIPIIANILDSMKPVVDIVAAILNGLQLFVQNGLGEFINILAPLGPSLQLLLSTLGLLIGSALRPLMGIFQVVIGIISWLADIISFAIGVLSPFVEIMVWVFAALHSGFTTVWAAFYPLASVVSIVATALDMFRDGLVSAIIAINNGIVNFLRGIGFKGFGKILKKKDFEITPDEVPSVVDNTEATKENTRAVRDLAREFRNLPSGYKVERNIYESSSPTNMRSSATDPMDRVRAGDNRWRT